MILYQICLIILGIPLSLAHSYLPVIGIYANPDPYNSEDYVQDLVYSNYVRWLEAAGAEIMVIHSWYDTDTLDDILSRVNGVFFMGGSRDLKLSSVWEQNAAYILNKTITMNEQGIYFPLWGTCQGFELLHAILADDTVILTDYDAFNYAMSAILNENTRTAKMFSFFSEEDFGNFEKKNTSAHFHNLGVDPDDYDKYPRLKSFFKITSLGTDLDGKVFVNTVESPKYPVYAVQFHPEKIAFDNDPNDDIPQSLEAILISQNFAHFVVNEARKNEQRMSVEDRTKYDFINSYVKGHETYENGMYKYSKIEGSSMGMEIFLGGY